MEATIKQILREVKELNLPAKKYFYNSTLGINGFFKGIHSVKTDLSYDMEDNCNDKEKKAYNKIKDNFNYYMWVNGYIKFKDDKYVNNFIDSLLTVENIEMVVNNTDIWYGVLCEILEVSKEDF